MALERTPLSEATNRFVDAHHTPPPVVAEAYERFSERADAEMMTHPDVGRLLATLVEASGGTRVLEIGTFVGISALWMTAALPPGGHLDTLEVDPTHAELAEGAFRRAGVLDRVRIHVGRAGDTLRRLSDGAYDLAYIDADKPSYPEYLRACLRLLRPGGMLVADNVFLGGDAAEADTDAARAMRAFVEEAAAHDGLATTILTMGDGVLLGVTRA
jgi:predicted O-methyltransferase YrrM